MFVWIFILGDFCQYSSNVLVNPSVNFNNLSFRSNYHTFWRGWHFLHWHRGWHSVVSDARLPLLFSSSSSSSSVHPNSNFTFRKIIIYCFVHTQPLRPIFFCKENWFCNSTNLQRDAQKDPVGRSNPVITSSFLHGSHFFPLTKFPDFSLTFPVFLSFFPDFYLLNILWLLVNIYFLWVASTYCWA